jgi:uncharacterized membrane protein
VVWSSGTAAFADFRVCNRTLVHVDVSLGWDDRSSGWTSQGWWNLPSGSCATVFWGDLRGGAYYLYATSEDGRLWAASDSDTGGAFCISTAKYITHNRDYRSGRGLINCESAGLQGKNFRRVDTENYAHFTYNLRSHKDDPLRLPAITSSPAPEPQSAQPAPTGAACQRYPNLC